MVAEEVKKAADGESKFTVEERKTLVPTFKNMKHGLHNEKKGQMPPEPKTFRENPPYSPEITLYQTSEETQFFVGKFEEKEFLTVSPFILRVLAKSNVVCLDNTYFMASAQFDSLGVIRMYNRDHQRYFTCAYVFLSNRMANTYIAVYTYLEQLMIKRAILGGNLSN